MFEAKTWAQSTPLPLSIEIENCERSQDYISFNTSRLQHDNGFRWHHRCHSLVSSDEVVFQDFAVIIIISLFLFLKRRNVTKKV